MHIELTIKDISLHKVDDKTKKAATNFKPQTLDQQRKTLQVSIQQELEFAFSNRAASQSSAHSHTQQRLPVNLLRSRGYKKQLSINLNDISVTTTDLDQIAYQIAHRVYQQLMGAR